MSVKFGFDVKELIRADRIKEDDIKAVKKWAKSESLPEFSDELVATFLVACKNEVQNAKICAREYYLGRNRSPEVFSNRDVNDPDIVTQFDTL